MKQKMLTLIFPMRDGQVLLGQKKRGFGEGKWNGFGGKIEQGESVRDGACRELFEECGIRATELSDASELIFVYEHTQEEYHVTAYRCTAWEGTPLESEEMEPRWFPLDAIPYDACWVNDPYWLPQFLAGKTVHGRFVFSDFSTITHVDVTPPPVVAISGKTA